LHKFSKNTSSKTHIKASRIAIVFVLFYPETNTIKFINNFIRVGYQLIAVVNGADEKLILRLNKISGLHLIINKKNVGLAKALNQGINYAFNIMQIRFVALFDQDSEPSPQHPLVLARTLLKHYDKNIACVAPKIQDIKNRSLQKIDSNYPFLFVKSAITSGSVIPKEVFLEVGPMNETLFIDGIDHDWCFRATSKGYKIALNADVVMKHNLGENYIRLLNIFIPFHRSPLRHYYIIRNSIVLMKKGYVPPQWKLIEFFKMIRRFVFYLFVSEDKFKTLKYTFFAVFDGIFNRLGEFKN